SVNPHSTISIMTSWPRAVVRDSARQYVPQIMLLPTPSNATDPTHGPVGVVSANKNSRISATRGPHNIGLTPYQPDILLLMFKLSDVSECRTLRRSLCSSSEACRSHRLCVLQVGLSGFVIGAGGGI